MTPFDAYPICPAYRAQNERGKWIFRSIANSYGEHRNLVLGNEVRLVHSCEHRWLAMSSCATVKDKKVHPVVDVWESTEAKSAHS